MEETPTPKQIVWDYIISRAPSDDEWEYLFASMFDRLSEDDVVDWFVGEVFGCDEDEILSCLDAEKGEIVIAHYYDHCQR